MSVTYVVSDMATSNGSLCQSDVRLDVQVTWAHQALHGRLSKIKGLVRRERGSHSLDFSKGFLHLRLWPDLIAGVWQLLGRAGQQSQTDWKCPPDVCTCAKNKPHTTKPFLAQQAQSDIWHFANEVQEMATTRSPAKCSFYRILLSAVIFFLKNFLYNVGSESMQCPHFRVCRVPSWADANCLLPWSCLPCSPSSLTIVQNPVLLCVSL